MNAVSSNTLQLKRPYLIFLGDLQDFTLAKTGAGLATWCKDEVIGQYRMAACTVDLGLEELSIEQAARRGCKSLVIGVASVGGGVSEAWIPALVQALQSGLDIVNGLHTDLRRIEALAKAEQQAKGKIVNVRLSPPDLPIGTARKRAGKRLLTVGTDCAVGKKFTALALSQHMREAGFKADFRATGQTGIMIAGAGIPIDAVVSDFLCGAAECLSPDNDSEHWDIIEGQGSLFNPSFSGVSLGLLHGSQPDAIILCHDAGREQVSTCPRLIVPGVRECIDMNLKLARLVNPGCQCVGVSVNTSSLNHEQRKKLLRTLSRQTDLPCIDPIIEGCAPFLAKINKHFPPRQS